MSTCHRLDLQTLGSQAIMPKNLSDHCMAGSDSINGGAVPALQFYGYDVNVVDLANVVAISNGMIPGQ